MQLAILDDYQDVARGLADWSEVAADVTVFTDHIDDEPALVARFAPFEILCLMRERTPLGRWMKASSNQGPSHLQGARTK